MKTLELVRQQTDVINTSWDVIAQLCDFIKESVDSKTFIWIWMRNDDWILWWQIYSEMDNHRDTNYEDLIYESLWEYYPIIDFIDGNPALIQEDWYTKIKARLEYLADKDLIPNTL